MTIISSAPARSAAAVTLALVLAGCFQSEATQAPPPPPAVSVAAVVQKDVAYWDEFPGRIESVERVEIRPRVSGYIESVSFREGEEVKKGDVLFIIDQRPYRAELARAEADLARARTQAELTRTQAARAKALLESRAISQEEYDERLASESTAGADVRAAQAAVEVARLNLEFTEVRSPVDGRAGRALITQGNLVQPGAAVLTTVVSLDPVYVYFDADEQAYLRYAELGLRDESGDDACVPVLVGLADETGFPHKGCLDFLNNQLDPATGTIRARALLDNAERTFTHGLFARVKLAGSAPFTALLVDDKAVLTDQDRKFVYVLGPDNRAQRRDVTLGRTSEGLRVVTSGLAVGDQVIVHGVQKIFMPGMPVTPQTIRMGESLDDAATAARAEQQMAAETAESRT